jgi:hypothetical protein
MHLEKEKHMPDLDMIDRGSAPGWHKPFRLLEHGEATPEEIGHAVLHSLCRSLRLYGGVPGLHDIADIVDRTMSGRCGVAEAFRHLRAIEQAAHGHRHTRVAVRAANGLLVEIGQGRQLARDPAQEVADRFCHALIDHQLFGRVRPALVGERFASHDEAIACERACVDVAAPYVSRVAENLARDPRATRLRAPRMSGTTRRSTADLLDEPLAV